MSSRSRKSSRSGSRKISRRKSLSKPVNKKLSGSWVARDKLTTRFRKYKTHDNGGRPFLVKANRESISVFSIRTFDWDGSDEQWKQHMKEERTLGDEIIYPNLLVKLDKFLGYWSGYDSEDHSCCNMKPLHGNSILIQVDLHRYIFIGDHVYSFETPDVIVDYLSPVGPNDVPYPVAFGSKYVYFMLDYVGILRDNLITPITVIESSNLYSEYYGHYPPIVYPQGIKEGTPKAKKYARNFRQEINKRHLSSMIKMKNFRMIQERDR